MSGEFATGDLAARLRRLSASAISDVLDECGYPHQALASGIRALDARMRMAGTAACFEGASTLDADGRPTGGDSLPSFEMDRRLGPEVVAVIAAQGHAASTMLGGLMGLAFKGRGCEGVVTDGGVRDVTELVELGLPTFCAYVTPLNAARRWKLTAADVTVELPGQAASRVAIAPGDYVIGDADGVVVVPRAIAAQVIAWAEELARIEQRIVRALEAGESRERALAEHPRFRHIARLRP